MSKPFISNCRLLLSFLLVLGATLAAQTPQWEQLPPTPELPKPDRSGTAAVNGIRIWYAVFGQGEPVIFIHGGMGSSNYWGLQNRPGLILVAPQFEIVSWLSASPSTSSPFDSTAALLPLGASCSIVWPNRPVQVGPAPFATLVKPQPVALGGVK